MHGFGAAGVSLIFVNKLPSQKRLLRVMFEFGKLLLSTLL